MAACLSTRFCSNANRVGLKHLQEEGRRAGRSAPAASSPNTPSPHPVSLRPFYASLLVQNAYKLDGFRRQDMLGYLRRHCAKNLVAQGRGDLYHFTKFILVA